MRTQSQAKALTLNPYLFHLCHLRDALSQVLYELEQLLGALRTETHHLLLLRRERRQHGDSMRVICDRKHTYAEICSVSFLLFKKFILKKFIFFKCIILQLPFKDKNDFIFDCIIMAAYTLHSQTFLFWRLLQNNNVFTDWSTEKQTIQNSLEMLY